MLILPHAQGLGVYFHEFGQGIHQATADGNGATHRYVILRELLPPHIGGRIHGSAVFAHGEDAHLFRQTHLSHEIFCLAAGGAAANGYDFNLILVHQVRHLDNGIHLFGHRRMRINHIMAQQIALLVQAHHLAARAEAGVNGHHALLPHRRGQQQLPQVLPKHLDALNIGLLLGLP